MSQDKTLCEVVREMENFDRNGVTTISKYVSQNMRADIDKTEAYYNSKQISGDTDANGRRKPFKNICYPAVNIWYRATDLDSKQMLVRAGGNDQVISALLATIKLQEWMNKINFGQFLNEWGHTLAKHGSAVVEIVEKDNELSIRVLDWNSLIVDPIDFDANIKIKKLWLTPSQLKQNKSYDKESVDSLLDNLEARETIDGQKKDTKSDYILVYEVHGEMPLSYLTDNEEDDEEYVQQMHVLAFKATKESGKYNDYTLFRGREKKSPMKLTHLIKIEGQTYVGGAVKNLFEDQWTVNEDEKMMRDQLLIASKIFFQGSDPDMAGSNFFSNVDNGEYLHHKPNEPMTRVSTTPDIGAMQGHQNSTLQHANMVNGIADAMISQAKSGTAWRQTQAELQEAHSLFELMTETKGLYLKEIWNEYLLDFFKKQLKNNKAISKILEAHEIKQIDSKYLPAEVNRRVEKRKKDTILSGEIYDPSQEQADVAQVSAEVQGELSAMGNQRFIQPDKENWAKEFEDLDWDLELDVTGESKDVQATMATLNTALTFVASLQGRPMSDDERFMFNELLKVSGTISPLQLSLNQSVPTPPQSNQPQPMMAGG